jgi:serine/threonine-protein phosphatase 6 regulatory ankyrin repeat subunit B
MDLITVAFLVCLQQAVVVPPPPVVRAAEAGETINVEALLSAGADLLARDTNGRTALHAAAANQHEDTFKALLNFTGDQVGKLIPEISKDSQVAVAQGLLAIEQRKRILNAADENGATALMFVARSGWTDLASALLIQGADPRIRDKSGRHASDYASAAGHTELANYLRTAERAEN